MTPQQFVAQLQAFVGQERYREAVDLAAEHYRTMAPLLAFEERSFVWGMMEVAVEAADAQEALDAEAS